MTSAAPGWYPDPADSTITRYWDGTGWNGERRWNGTEWVERGHPTAVPTAVSVPAGAAWATPSQQPGYPAAAPYPAQAMATATRKPVAVPLRNRMILLLAGAALIIIACLLPWASQNYVVTTKTINGTSAGGGQFSIVLALAIAALGALVLTGIIGPKKGAIATLAIGALDLVICLANMANISSVMGQEQSEGLGDTGAGTSFGIGLVILLIADIIVIVASILTLVSRRRNAV